MLPNHYQIGISILFFLIGSLNSYGQEGAIKYTAGTKILAASEGELPFWHFSNVLGTVDPSGTNSISFLEAKTRFLEGDHFFLSADMTAIGRLSNDNSLHLPEYQFSANWHGFQFDAGRFARPVTYNHRELTTGSMVESRNAIPLNRIMISNPEYKPVPFTNGVVEYKGMMSHGWFSDQRFTRNTFLHQKDLFAKIYLNRFTLKGGLSHNVMWGGQNPQSGKLPSGFGDFIDVFFGNSASRNDNVPEGEVLNRLGNTLLYFAFALDYEHERFDLSVTRSFLKEDTGSKATRSPWDGIFGANVSFEDEPLFGFLDNILYEYINTIRQQAKDEEARGRANFYNNFLYKSGWTSRGRVIGPALAVFDEAEGRITNNMFIGHHLGFSGNISDDLKLKTLVTYSRNYGTFRDRRNDVPFDGVSDPQAKKFFFDRSLFREDQYSLFLSAELPIFNEHWKLEPSVSWDLGEFYTDNVGFGLSISRSGVFSY